MRGGGGNLIKPKPSCQQMYVACGGGAEGFLFVVGRHWLSQTNASECVQNDNGIFISVIYSVDSAAKSSDVLSQR